MMQSVFIAIDTDEEIKGASDDVSEGETSEENREWLMQKLSIDDNLLKKGEALLAQMLGDVPGPTIFKRDSKAVLGHRELPKPRAVAIGPYHRDDLLRFNDDFKWKITRFMVKKWSLDVEKYLKEMKKDKRNARNCYTEGLSNWRSKDFRMMLLLDSSFIIFMMDAYAMEAFYERPLDFPSDVTRGQEHVALYADIREHRMQIKLDLLTFDNQIPFLAIKNLFDCFRDNHVFKINSIRDLALSCFDDLWPTRNKEQNMDDENNSFDHLLQLFHFSRIPVEGYEMSRWQLNKSGRQHNYKMSRLIIPSSSDEQPKMSNNRLHEKIIASERRHIPSATELQKSASKFKKKDTGSNLDITFTRTWTKTCAVINIPTLHLYDYTEEIFRNLIAFEMNPANDVRCFTAYLACMSCLLQREEDVQLLRESDTIASTGYNNANVVQLFKDLNREVQDHTMPETLHRLYRRVKKHHNSCVSKAYGGFKMHYCSNMWVGLSLVAASILFTLTLLQTTYTMLYK